EPAHMRAAQPLGGIGETAGTIGTLPGEHEPLVLAAGVLEHDAPDAERLADDRDVVLVDHDRTGVSGIGRARPTRLVIRAPSAGDHIAGLRRVDGRLERPAGTDTDGSCGHRDRAHEEREHRHRQRTRHRAPLSRGRSTNTPAATEVKARKVPSIPSWPAGCRARRAASPHRTMTARDFPGLRSTPNPHRWVLPIERGICVRHAGFLFGGCGLGAAVTALEAVTGRQLVWATAQYLSYARPPEILDLDVTIPISGHHSSQARATGHVGDREIFPVNASLGRRPLDVQGGWAVRAQGPPPDSCPG